MKGIYLYYLAFFLFSFAGCKSTDRDVNGRKSIVKQIQPTDFDYNKIKERGYLIALIDNSSTGLFLYKGRTMGYEYELLKMFTDSIGVGLRIEVVTNLEDAFEKLNKGEGDIMAYNLTVTKERKERIAFSHYHNLVRLVLVQRKPDNWRDMKLHEIENTLIRNPVDLIGEMVYVRYQSSYFDRLINLADEIGGDIIIVEDDPETETEEIIRRVSDGEIDYTVAEEDVALVNATYHTNLDVKTAVSFPQQIAWGVRKNAPFLLDTLNNWIVEMRKHPDYYTVYNKYYKSSKTSKRRKVSEYSTIGGGKLSPFDSLIKSNADSLGWDWRLLAAQIFKESKFDPKIVSWAGAVGLMQLLPTTGQEYGVTNLKDPSLNLYAGRSHILWLDDLWKEMVDDPNERLKFVLASYNVGHGHVRDARKLAKKYDVDPNDWTEVSEYLLKKSNPAYFNDPVVEFGYCRGIEPVQYVEIILDTYETYQAMFPDDEQAN
ncbi:MAG: membrane-bound lytic murein transglycosylase F [Paraglaciecola sp.]|jgi:membrane-bound lytic murein transglycosylase F